MCILQSSCDLKTWVLVQNVVSPFIIIEQGMCANCTICDTSWGPVNTPCQMPSQSHESFTRYFWNHAIRGSIIGTFSFYRAEVIPKKRADERLMQRLFCCCLSCNQQPSARRGTAARLASKALLQLGIAGDTKERGCVEMCGSTKYQRGLRLRQEKTWSCMHPSEFRPVGYMA